MVAGHTGRSLRRRLGVGVLAAAVFFSGCGGGGPTPPAAGQATAVPTPPAAGQATAVPTPPAAVRVASPWLDPGQGRLDAPGGVFVDISVSALSSCGIREGGELVCWGEHRAYDGWGHVVPDAPAQWKFEQVVLWNTRNSTDTGFEGDHACGLRVDGAVVCWGMQFEGLGDALEIPAGEAGSGKVWVLGGGEGPAVPGGFADIWVGDSGVCGTRGDGSAACWNGLGWFDAGSPAGARALYVDRDRSCGVPAGGVPASGGFDCWARVVSGPESGLPEGVFTALSADGGAGCALGADGRPACWGGGEYREIWDQTANEYAPDHPGFVPYPADAVLSQVSADVSGLVPYWYVCGIEAGGKAGPVVCWGSNYNDQTGPPEGDFVQVEAWGGDPCGVRDSGEVVCWGRLDFSTGASHGRFARIAVDDSLMCGLRADATMVCPDSYKAFFLPLEGGGESNPRSNPPDPGLLGGIAQISVSTWSSRDPQVPDNRDDRIACGLRADATAFCWRPGADWDPVEVPGAGHAQISTAGLRHFGGAVCTRSHLGEVACWLLRDDRSGWDELLVPDRALSAIDARGPCGIQADTGALICWRHALPLQLPPKAGTPEKITANAEGTLCAIGASDGALACWHTNTPASDSAAEGTDGGPGGEVLDVSVGPNGALCAIGADYTLACWGKFTGLISPWGDLWAGEANAPPDGEYSRVAVSHFHACALTTGGTATCWGNENDGPRGHSRYIEDEYMPIAE